MLHIITVSDFHDNIINSIACQTESSDKQFVTVKVG